MGRIRFFAAVFVLLFCAMGRSTVIDIPLDFPTIQQGIDASVNGDTVLVAEGTYNERIDFSGKAILVASNYIFSGDTTQIYSTIIDADTSIIGPDDMGSVVCFVSGEDSLSVLRGFTIKNGIGSMLNIYNRMGGGIFCMGYSWPKILDNNITENIADAGGGLYMLGASNPQVRNNRITNNTKSGIWISGSSPLIENNFISGNISERGGGISCGSSSSPVIRDNIICGNYGGLWGGGIFCENSSPVIKRNLIYGNSVIDWGGGICCDSATPTIINNVVSDNIASGEGGGLYCFNNASVLVINTILWANSPPEVSYRSGGTYQISYSDIRGGGTGQSNIDVDPFFVSAYEGDYNVCSQSPCIDAGDPAIHDPDGSISDIGVYFPDHPTCDIGKIVYVSTQGSDETGDGTVQNPYRTINHSADEAYSGDTVLVQNGIYEENVMVTAKYVYLASNYIFSQDTLDIQGTVIDGGADTSTAVFSNCDSTTAIIGFTLRNGLGWFGGGIFSNYSDLLISHNIITGNSCAASGGGIDCRFGGPEIGNNRISNNDADIGGGISCNYSAADIRHNIIYGNDAYKGGGIYTSNQDENTSIDNNIIYINTAVRGAGLECFGTVGSMNNNLFYGNAASDYGGAVSCHISSPEIINSIFWGDTGPSGGDEIYTDGSSSPTITYCDVQGGWQNVGNIDLDPLFRDPAGGDFHLMSVACGDSADSPCIDAGHPDSLDIVLGCRYGLGGPRADMGAYGGNNGDWVTAIGGGEFEENSILPEEISLFQNYPNPFNAATTIEYSLPKPGHVRIAVYDLLGREVRVLVDEYIQAGIHAVVFNASVLSSGIYFYRLQAGGKVETKRMVLLK